MTKATWIPTAIAVLACTLCIAVAQQPTVPGKIPNAVEEVEKQSKQQPQMSPLPANVGRYQSMYLGRSGYYLILDSHTGQCWEKHPESPRFQDIGVPSSK